ncbi:hypothetical protein [Curtobacterium sp. PhB191]|uniref:hypothetical protein n=1 Tax=Curtobacterium sp. PhB191 TaxID=2485202 RepID=UPI001049D7E5|nr:hypothetical protein [Curtobacterium sp. PhB191]
MIIMHALLPALQGVAVLLFGAVVVVAIVVAVKLRRVSTKGRDAQSRRLDDHIREVLLREGFTEDEVRQAQRDTHE